MEQQLLEAVLSSQLELSAALAWALGDGSEPPPFELRLGSPWKSPNAPRPALRPADFRVHALNYVREQAELVLAAAEQEAAGCGSSEAGSQPPTPQPQPGSIRPMGWAAVMATARRDKPVRCGGGGAPLQQQIQQQQQQPGQLDDENFPTLAAAAAGGGKRNSGAGGTSLANPQPAGKQQQQGSKRRTIVPAKVVSLEVNPLFQLPEAQLPQQLQQQLGQQQPPAAQAVQQPIKVQQAASMQAVPKQRAAAAARQLLLVPPPAPEPEAATAASLPMSPPPIAVRLPAPGATAVAASLLLCSGAVGVERALPSPSATVGSPGGEGSTPKRITPIRMAYPAEVQRTFITATSGAATPRSARRDMLLQPEMQQRSHPGSSLGTPLASGVFGGAPLMASAALGTKGSDSSGGDGSGAAGAGSPSQPLWSAEEQSVCQKLSFDVLSPTKLAEAATSAAAAAADKVGSKPSNIQASATGGAVAAHASLQPPLEQKLQGLELGTSSMGSGDGCPAASRQQRILDATMQRIGDRLVPGGSATNGSFDPPSSFPPSATRPLEFGGNSTADSVQVQPQPSGAVGQLQAQLEAQEMQLCPQGRLLAELHAGLLRCCSSISLSAELDLLLNLLAVSSVVHIDPSLTSVTVLSCGDLAQQYACCVLQSAGGLIAGLGPALLQDLVGLPLVRGAYPRLHAAMQAALQHFASTQLHTEKAYRNVHTGGGILSLHGLSAFTSDGRRTRSQEEQRRISNREGCRDEWFALMREAAAQTHSFAARQLSHLASGASDWLSESRRTATPAAMGAGGDEAGLLGLVQQSAADLLRRLRPDNFPAFAELFTAAVLQAAATGEPLLDEELSRLARKNVGRFHSLNQRLQAQGAAGPSRGGAVRLQSNQPTTATGFGHSSGGSRAGQQGRWAGGGGGGGGCSHQQPPPQQRGPGGRGGGGSGPGFGSVRGADEAVAESLRLVAEFPRVQRLHVLFLEAADSHRLNTHLIRCMSGKLRALTTGEHAGGGLSERVAAVSTLAMFLSYLTFTRAGCASSDGGEAGAANVAAAVTPAAAAYDSSHPVDVAAALEAAVAASEGVQLAWTLPWAVRYLWFVKWDAEAVHAQYFRRLLGRMAALHGTPELQPQHGAFSLAALCMRSVLDDFAERMGPDLMPSTSTSSGSYSSSKNGSSSSCGSCDSGGRPHGSPTATCPALSSLAAVDGLLDSRFLHLCCPTLEHARQLFVSSGSGCSQQQQQQQARRVKKIRPTAPSGAAAARAALAAGTNSSAAGGQAGGTETVQDLLKLQLQRAFLEQYSTDEHKFKLRDLVDYVSDLLAYNTASSVMAAHLVPAGDTIAAQLKEAATALAAESQHQQHQQQQEGSDSGGEAAAAAARVALLDPSVRLCLEGLTEHLIATHTVEVLQQAQAEAEERIRGGAVQAMAALTNPDLGPAVIGTAAAVVAEAATAAAEQRLHSQVPFAVRCTATEQLQHLLTSVARGGKTLRHAQAPAAVDGRGTCERDWLHQTANGKQVNVNL